MRKAYSYIRMSTNAQLKGDSLRRQLDNSKKYASENNLELIEFLDGIPLRDIGISGYKGKNSKTGVLAIFLKKLEENVIEPNSVLLIESLDRLSRDDVTNALSQFLRLINLGIEIITLTDNQKYTKENINNNVGSLYISLGVMFRANEESEIKSKRLKASWENKRNNALTKPLTSVAPAWLKLNSNKNEFEIIEKRADIIKKIFDLCINTCGLWAITKYLNTNQIPVFGRSKFWYKSYVKKILSNRSVLGEYQPKTLTDGKKTIVGKPIMNYYPRIIHEDEFILANAAIEARTVNGNGRKGISFSNLFTSLIYCGECNSKIVLRNRGSTSKGGKYLICSNKLVTAGCTMPEWKLSVFEGSMFNHIKEINFTEFLDNKSDSTDIKNQIILLNEKLKIEEHKLNNSIVLISENDLNNNTKARFVSLINDMELKIEDIKKEIVSLEINHSDIIEQNKYLKSNQLKEMINKIDENKDNYYFRSSLNQILCKTIKRIELKNESANYEPWEISVKSSIYKDFLKENPNFKDYTLEELFKIKEFKYFCKFYENRIAVKYKSGDVRHIFLGENKSLFLAAYPLKSTK